MINLQNRLTLHGFVLVQQKGERQHLTQGRNKPTQIHVIADVLGKSPPNLLRPVSYQMLSHVDLWG